MEKKCEVLHNGFETLRHKQDSIMGIGPDKVGLWASALPSHICCKIPIDYIIIL